MFYTNTSLCNIYVTPRLRELPHIRFNFTAVLRKSRNELVPIRKNCLFLFLWYTGVRNVNKHHSTKNTPYLISWRLIFCVHRRKVVWPFLNVDMFSKCSPFTSRQSWIRPKSEWRSDQCMNTIGRLTDIVWSCALLQYHSTRGGTGWFAGSVRSLPWNTLHRTCGLKFRSPIPLYFAYILSLPAPLENYLALLDRQASSRHFLTGCKLCKVLVLMRWALSIGWESHYI